MEWICKVCEKGGTVVEPCIMKIKGHGYVTPQLCPFFVGVECVWEVKQA